MSVGPGRGKANNEAWWIAEDGVTSLWSDKTDEQRMQWLLRQTDPIVSIALSRFLVDLFKNRTRALRGWSLV